MSLPKEWSLQTESSEYTDEYIEEMEGGGGCVDVNNLNSENTLNGSLFSIHSAPVYELNIEPSSPKRPSSIVIPVVSSGNQHIISPDTIDDDDNLLTISSLTAKPLIAKSKELRLIKAKEQKKKKVSEGKNDSGDEEAPDGGYGWVVVFGAFFVQFWVAGLVKSYGVLFVEVMETYSDSSAAVASWIPALLSALCLALAPLSSALCRRFSCRKVVFIGGLFCALGLTLSYFAVSLLHLLFTFGVLTGIGGGLSTTPGIVMVSQYFTKHRALANGICISGTAAGSFVFPMLIEHLCDRFGFHGTILLLGGCMLHVCVSATLYRPLKPKEKEEVAKIETLPRIITPNLEKHHIFLMTPKEQIEIKSPKQLELLFDNDLLNQNDDKLKKNMLNDFFNQTAVLIEPNASDSEEEKDQIGETTFMKPTRSSILQRSSSILHSVEDLSTDSTCVYKSRHVKDVKEGISRSMFLVPQLYESVKDISIKNDVPPTPIIIKKSWSQKLSYYLDISLLKNMQFIMMCLSVTLMSTGSPYMLYYLPAYVISMGYTKSEAGYLVSICAALDLCGRLGFGWLSDLQLFERRKAYIGSIVGAGVAVLMIPVADSFYVMACSVGIYGLCLGCWFLLVPVLLADQFGIDKISSSYGLVRMFQSVAAISVPPLAGYMRDVTGGYDLCFYCMGTCMVLGGLPLLLVAAKSEHDKSKTSNSVSK